VRRRRDTGQQIASLISITLGFIAHHGEPAGDDFLMAKKAKAMATSRGAAVMTAGKPPPSTARLFMTWPCWR